MRKVELLLPAGNEECLRAAVNNGADAVYLGLTRFNAREYSGNFKAEDLLSIVKYCHKKNVKVYVAFNTLVKNHELNDYFQSIGVAQQAGADAVIIQDPYFVPVIKRNFPNLKIHLSTQATTTSSYSIPDVNRVILPRELSLQEIKTMSRLCETEIFVHGALCLSYSGQCLFSSIAGGRSGNRGKCAQPCRRIYNNEYALSTMDLCLLEKVPELIESGVTSFKIEGRMRGPLYVATAARIYRKYIDSYYKGEFKIEEKDLKELKTVFNREFTTGFAFNDSIIDSKKPMNRGVYIGTIRDGKLLLRENIERGDGIGIWLRNNVVGYKLDKIIKDSQSISEALKGDVIDLEGKDGAEVYKTGSVAIKYGLGEEIKKIGWHPKKLPIALPDIRETRNQGPIKIFVKVYDRESAIAADEAKADIVYYDVIKKDCESVKKSLKHSKFFVYTPRILSDDDLNHIVDRIKELKPDGVLVGNRGLLKFLDSYELHLDYSFNCINDIDLAFCKGIPILSQELNLKEIASLKNKRFIVQIHGDIILMTTKENIQVSELIDSEHRLFKVRRSHGITEILNSSRLGLFNRSREYLKQGIKYFYIDLSMNPGKFTRIYRRILNQEQFDDKKIRKGYTTGHFNRGVL